MFYEMNNSITTYNLKRTGGKARPNRNNFKIKEYTLFAKFF